MTGRTRISLDGTWDFRHAGDGALRQAPVPGPWQAAFPDLRQESGRATYARRFARSADSADRVAVLCFGAVSWSAVVRVNGTEIARHANGWLPFEAVIPDAILTDDNLVEVDCLLPDADPATADGLVLDDIPHGKQSWYGPAGGIWQSVTLEMRPRGHLTHCAIGATVDGRVNVATEWTGADGATAQFAIRDSAGTTVATGTATVADGRAVADLTVAAPALWSPDSPALYTLTVRAGADATDHSFGFRTFEARGGAFYLNGAPFYMRGALDQDYWPEGLQTPPSMAAIEDQFRKAKALGLNTLRCHIKVPDPRYHDAADRIGLLIWTEIPNVGTLTETSARLMRETMEGILRRDGNHPSIAIWTLINEDWGTRTFDDPAHRAWLKAEYDWLKQRDPGRLVVDNSPCHNNFHVKTDINDFHYYRSVPERRAEWDRLTAEFAGGADWAWSPFGDAQRRGDEPLVVSEFGVWGLPHPDQVRLNGAEPGWMETGGTWGDGAAVPHGVQARFADLRLAATFGSFDAFIAAVQAYQFMNLKYEIEVMREHPAIQGYVVTEFTDVHWESNGLLDMNRNPRPFADAFAAVNADVVIAPRLGRHAIASGGTVRFAPAVATGGQALRGAVLHWSAEGASGHLALPDSPALSLAEADEIAVPLAGPSRMVEIALRVVAGGAEVARSSVTVAVADRGAPPAVTLRVPDPALAARARALGYTVADDGAVTVVQALAEADIRALQAGARYLVLADGTAKTHRNLRVEGPRREQPFMAVVDDTPGIPQGPEAPLPNIGLVARQGTMWRGDWIASFSWVRRDGAFARLPGGPMLDLAWTDVVPHHVMTGFRAHDFGGPVMGGLVVGWVHKPAATIARRRVGRGELVATTFRLCTCAPGEDPIATLLFDALVETAATAARA